MSSFGDLNRVNTNIQSLDSQLSLNRINKNLSENQLRLSTGLRINRAEDDAAGFSIATTLKSRVAGLEQALVNVGDAKSILDIAEASFDTIMDNLIEMKGLATQAANDSLGATERGYIGEQIRALGTNINDVATQTVFQDFALLNGADGEHSGNLSLTFQVGERAADTLTTNLAAVNVNQLFSGSDSLGVPDATGQVGTLSVVTESTLAVGPAATGGITNFTEDTAPTTGSGGIYTFNLDLGDAAAGTIEIGGETFTFGTGVGEFSSAAELADLIDAVANFTASEDGGEITVTGPNGDTIAAPTYAIVDAGSAAQAGVYSFDITTAFAEGETITIAGTDYVMGTDFSGETTAAQAESLAGAIAFAGHTADFSGSTITLTEGTANGEDPTIAIETTGFAGGQGAMDLSAFDTNDYRAFIADIDSAITSMSQRYNSIGITQSSLSVR
ncbi:MAG: hypothetical protein EA360_03335, partial [Balneolaceae bacterium]